MAHWKVATLLPLQWMLLLFDWFYCTSSHHHHHHCGHHYNQQTEVASASAAGTHADVKCDTLWTMQQFGQRLTLTTLGTVNATDSGARSLRSRNPIKHTAHPGVTGSPKNAAPRTRVARSAREALVAACVLGSQVTPDLAVYLCTANIHSVWAGGCAQLCSLSRGGSPGRRAAAAEQREQGERERTG
ncbi:hypothetical protein TYRP_014356 [Tyrophagus putrescentiae]|nr:hypothetical protein TYRP_014356 [Tyrophagus putrescentiae]